MFVVGVCSCLFVGFALTACIDDKIEFRSASKKKIKHIFGYLYKFVVFFVLIYDMLIGNCNIDDIDVYEAGENSHLGDNCIQNLHLVRYIVGYTVGYTVGNLVLRRRASGAVKRDFRTYIRR